MIKVAVSIEDRHERELEAQQRLGNADSRSAAIRHIIDEYSRLRAECDELNTECERLQDRLEAREERIEELEDQLRKRQQIEEQLDELADLPDKVREAETYQDRRRRALDEAGVLTRLKWRVTGVPAEEIEPNDERPRRR